MAETSAPVSSLKHASMPFICRVTIHAVSVFADSASRNAESRLSLCVDAAGVFEKHCD